MATALCLPKMRNKLNHAYTVLIILSRHHKKTEINLKKNQKNMVTALQQHWKDTDNWGENHSSNCADGYGLLSIGEITGPVWAWHEAWHIIFTSDNNVINVRNCITDNSFKNSAIFCQQYIMAYTKLETHKYISFNISHWHCHLYQYQQYYQQYKVCTDRLLILRK